MRNDVIFGTLIHIVIGKDTEFCQVYKKVIKKTRVGTAVVLTLVPLGLGLIPF